MSNKALFAQRRDGRVAALQYLYAIHESEVIGPGRHEALHEMLGELGEKYAGAARTPATAVVASYSQRKLEASSTSPPA